MFLHILFALRLEAIALGVLLHALFGSRFSGLENLVAVPQRLTLAGAQGVSHLWRITSQTSPLWRITQTV